MGSRKKNCQGGGARPKIPPKTYGKRDPPHGENGLYVERNDSAHAHRKKYPHRGNCFPHINFFYSCSPPPPPPGRAPIMISSHFVPFV